MIKLDEVFVTILLLLSDTNRKLHALKINSLP